MSIPYSGSISMGQVAREQCKPLLNVKMRDISSFAGYVIKDSISEFYGYNRIYPSVSGLFSPSLSSLAMTKISGMTGIWGTGQITYIGSAPLNLTLKWYGSGQSSYPGLPELYSPWANAYATQLNLTTGQAFTLMTGYINTAETAISVNAQGFTCGQSYPAIATSTPVAVPPTTTTENSFVFDADFIVLTYQFTDGQDLDIKVRMASPDIGQNTVAKYIGYPGTASHTDNWPQTGRPILSWGGDQTGIGLESVLIDVVGFQLAYPTATKMIIDLRASWFVTKGFNPVSVIAKMYTGGTMAVNTSTRNWVCTGFSATSTVNSVSKSITSMYTTGGSGDRLATLTYDISTGLGTFNTNDTTTPTV